MGGGKSIPCWLLGAYGALCAACTGTISSSNPRSEPQVTTAGRPGVPGGSAADGGSAAASTNSAGSSVESAVTSSAYPRLSHRQWALAAQDLLHLDAPPDVSGFSADAPVQTGFDNTSDRLEVSQGLWGDYQTVSEALAADVARTPDKLAKITPAGLPSAGAMRAQAFVASLAERAFRRPPTQDELTAYVTLFQQGPTLVPGRDELSAGAELTIQALLQSPAFIYRVENQNPPAQDDVAQLSDYEIAARLSFMFWDTALDSQLMAAAKAGELHTPAQIAAEARRMLDAPRAADKLLEFHRQLLELRRYDTLHPEGLPASIGADLRSETERFVQAVLVDARGSFADLFRASYSFVNHDVAQLYGLSGDYGSDFVRADLDPEQRAGLLTQPGFLIARSGDTAPILRGVFINLKFLCADLPPPPVFTPPRMTGETRRERVESVTGKGTCGEGCHARVINPAGFPLEYFDDQGRYRTEDNGHAVDGSASYSFSDGARTFDGPSAWAAAIASSEQAHACYVRHWLEFGFGRAYAAGDAALVARVAEASRSTDMPVKELLVLLVQSPSFTTRRVEAP